MSRPQQWPDPLTAAVALQELGQIKFVTSLKLPQIAKPKQILLPQTDSVPTQLLLLHLLLLERANQLRPPPGGSSACSCSKLYDWPTFCGS